MKIELTEKQVEFLIRALIYNFGATQEDYCGENITESNVGDFVLGKLAQSSGSSFAYFENIMGEQFKKKPLPDRRLFMGAGYHSILHFNDLCKRLKYISGVLGGKEQNGGMGTIFDEKSDSEDEKEIKDSLREIILAFGYTPKDLL